jgi:flagellar hook-associated protein 2
MGMRVNTGSGIDPKMVDKLIEAERLPIKRVEERKNAVSEEQKSYKELGTLVSELGTSLGSLRNRTDFVKLKLESSHPDILDGTVDSGAVPGSYELEVRQMAKNHKLLAEAFPDEDETPVGFGFMSIELEDGEVFDIDVDPSASTLKDVARQINEAGAGAKAIILNTKENLEDPDADTFRLLVISEKSGKQARVTIDPDTTYLEFKEQVTGKNLEVLFEDVPVFDSDNTLESLMPGLTLTAKRAEPGTKISVKIDYDSDKSAELIQKFVESYNKVNSFVDKQFQLDPKTQKAGALSRDNTLRSLRRTIQGALQYRGEGKYANITDVGISSDARTGDLKIDDAKLKKALSEDYNAVAQLFSQTAAGPGIATVLSDAIRGIQNSQTGYLGSKDREYKRVLENFDKDIERKERLVSQRADGIRRKFAALEQLVSGMQAQGQAMQARLGAAGAG